MGVADNRSYKNEYLFQDDRNYNIKEEQPSIHEEPKINSTIKENPYRSNVEIEGGEIVLQPDLTALFKAKGKKHSQGGMDVLLKPESFIFSDFKGLDFTKKDHELFELKEGGKNTPAEVLKRNVDIKHYNTMVSILDDPYKDDLSKKSAALMLEKYLQNLGNIAYIQEEKKGFPQGLPSFSVGTAPVYDPSIKQAIMENKQYMKAGGTTKNPYAQMGMINGRPFTLQGGTDRRPKDPNAVYDPITGKWYVRQFTDGQNTSGTNQNQVTPPPQNPQSTAMNTSSQSPWGLWQGDKLPIFQDRYGTTNAADKFDNLKNWDAVASSLGYNGPKNNLAFQKWLYNSSPENKAIVDKWHNQYSKGPNAGMFDSKIGIRWASAINEIMGTKSPRVDKPDMGLVDKTGTKWKIPMDDIQKTIESPEDPAVPNIDVTPQGSKQADWRFTPWQKLSHLNNLGQFANVRRYMPYRSRYNATYVDPALVNPEQAIGDIKSVGNQQLSSLTTLNPILRNAQAASISGQIMNQLPGVRSQYDNQNAQILNQTRQYNNQVKNNESLVNMGNDQQYYTQSVEGRKNFENMRNFTWNNYTNNIMRDVETNQKLAYNLLTQNQPAYNFDWRTGNFTRTNKSIMDVQSNAVNDRYSDMIQSINQISDPVERNKLLVKLEGLKIFGQAQQTPSVFKKGGKTKKNPY